MAHSDNPLLRCPLGERPFDRRINVNVSDSFHGELVTAARSTGSALGMVARAAMNGGLPVVLRKLSAKSAAARLILLAALLAADAAAQPSGPGLFVPLGAGLSAEITALASPPRGAGARPGVIRSRRVTLDFRLLGDRADVFLAASGAVPGAAGRPVPLLANFFDDVALEFLVDAVDPAVLGSGYVVSASPADGPGSFVIAVHTDSAGRIVGVSGSASAPAGVFRISEVGGGVYEVEEVDAAAPWADDVVPLDPADFRRPPPSSPDSSGADPASPDSSAASEIDVLVFYTPAAAAAAGGDSSMRAEVERLFAETNRAFRGSGVQASVAGWARPLEYTESRSIHTDLDRLVNDADGWIDDVHPLRSELGADLVHLVVEFTPEDLADNGKAYCGVAYSTVHPALGFGLTSFHRRCVYTFAHEIGHNLGLLHDRYQEFGEGDTVTAHVPFAYGYSNAADFSPVSGGQCWATVMAYHDHCFDVPGGRAYFSRILRFSTPFFRHSSGEPLGAVGEVETVAVDGPADAARAIDLVAGSIAAWYRRPDPEPVLGVDAAVTAGTVSISPVVVDVFEPVYVGGFVANVGPGFIRSSRTVFWSRYDDPEAEWLERSSKTLGGLIPGGFDVRLVAGCRWLGPWFGVLGALRLYGQRRGFGQQLRTCS